MSAPFALTAGSADAEKPLLEAQLAGTLAARAHFDGIRGACSGALTVAARFPTRNLEFGFLAVDGFLKRHIQIVLEIVAALGPAAAAGSAEKVFKNIVEDLAEASAPEVEALKPAGACLRAGMSEHIVPFAFVLVTQDLVGFIDFFELFFRSLLLFRGGLQVRMKLAGKLAKSFFQLVVRRVAFNS